MRIGTVMSNFVTHATIAVWITESLTLCLFSGFEGWRTGAVYRWNEDHFNDESFWKSNGWTLEKADEG